MKGILYDLCHLHYFTYLHFGSDKGHIDTDLPGLSIALVKCWQHLTYILWIKVNKITLLRRTLSHKEDGSMFCFFQLDRRSQSFPGKHTAKTQACSHNCMGDRARRRSNN